MLGTVGAQRWIRSMFPGKLAQSTLLQRRLLRRTYLESWCPRKFSKTLSIIRRLDREPRMKKCPCFLTKRLSLFKLYPGSSEASSWWGRNLVYKELNKTLTQLWTAQGHIPRMSLALLKEPLWQNSEASERSYCLFQPIPEDRAAVLQPLWGRGRGRWRGPNPMRVT